MSREARPSRSSRTGRFPASIATAMQEPSRQPPAGSSARPRNSDASDRSLVASGARAWVFLHHETYAYGGDATVRRRLSVPRQRILHSPPGPATARMSKCREPHAGGCAHTWERSRHMNDSQRARFERQILAERRRLEQDLARLEE